MRLRQVHRAGPGAVDQLRQIELLLLVRAVGKDRGDRALGQARIHHQRHVGRDHVFADGGVDGIGEPLAAIFGRRRQPQPAALAILPVGVAKALRRRHRAVLVAHAALRVANAVERGDHVLGELRPLVQDRLQHVRRGVGEAWQVGITLVTEHVLEHEQRIAHRRRVDRHGILLDMIEAALPGQVGTARTRVEAC